MINFILNIPLTVLNNPETTTNFRVPRIKEAAIFNLNCKNSWMWPTCCIACHVRLIVQNAAKIYACNHSYVDSLLNDRHNVFSVRRLAPQNCTFMFRVMCSAYGAQCAANGIFWWAFIRSHLLIHVLCELCHSSEQGKLAHVIRLPHNQ